MHFVEEAKEYRDETDCGCGDGVEEEMDGWGFTDGGGWVGG